MGFSTAAAQVPPPARETLLRIYFLDGSFDFSDLVMDKGVLARAACALQYFDRSVQDLAESKNASPAYPAHQMALRRRKSHGW